MAADFAGILLSFLCLSLLTVLPGYALGWLCNLFDFRTRGWAFRLATSVPLALAAGPIVSYFSGAWVWGFYAPLSIFGALLLVRDLRYVKPTRQQLAVLAMVAAWGLVAVIALSDLQIGRKLYFSVIGFDYAVRSAFVSSISTFGVPARNPFFFPAHPEPLRYHWFWPMQTALVHRLLGGTVTARQAFCGGTIWCGIGLISTVALYLRLFSSYAQTAIVRRLLIAIPLLCVTGLDLVPALFFLVLSKCGLTNVIPPSAEWWNEQVDGWLYTMLWEPHYLCALIACLMGFLLIWYASRRIVPALFAGLAFASATGAGIYVAIVFAAFLLVWTVMELARRRWREAALLVLSGALAAALSLPFLNSLRGPSSGGKFLQLSLRGFFPTEIIAQAFQLGDTARATMNFLALPVNYFCEFGFFFAVAVIAWRKASRPALAIAITSLLICSFVRSGVISNNDLGWRGMLIVQFVVLIWAADLLAFRALRSSKLLLVLAMLGLAGTLYDQVLLRFFPLFSDAKLVPKIAWLASDEKLGERTYANREAYQWIRAHSSNQAVIQQNAQPAILDIFYGLYADRQTIAEDPQCGSEFGGDPTACPPLQAQLQGVFAADASESILGHTCGTLPLDFLIAKDTDAAWSSPSSWVWRRTPSFSNSFVRVFRCRDALKVR